LKPLDRRDQEAELGARARIDEGVHAELVEGTGRGGIGGDIEAAGQIVQRIGNTLRRAVVRRIDTRDAALVAHGVVAVAQAA
jgi:hypothetical protein